MQEPLQTQPENDAPPLMQQPYLVGERQLSEEDAVLINLIRKEANEVGAMFNHLMLLNKDHHQPPYDPRWIATAKTQMQLAFMTLERAITQKATF